MIKILFKYNFCISVIYRNLAVYICIVLVRVWFESGNDMILKHKRLNVHQKVPENDGDGQILYPCPFQPLPECRAVCVNELRCKTVKIYSCVCVCVCVCDCSGWISVLRI